MRLEIVSFAKNKEKALAAAENEYLRRLTREVRVELVELTGGKSGSLSEQQIQEAEAGVLLKRLKPGSVLIALAEAGKEFTSPQFAEFLGRHMNQGTPALTFAIAGPSGWAAPVTESAQMLLSLGRMTFPAHVARFLLVEQIYRALCILKGHPYHK